MKINRHCTWPDNSIYFLTASTFLHFPYFQDYKQKEIVLNQIKKIKHKLKIPVIAYSIAINHYHAKFYLKNGKDLSKVKQLIHSGVSHEYRKHYPIKYNNIWQSSKAIVTNSGHLNLITTGYVISNLLKHKEVSTFSELEKNPFSSYKYFKDLHGENQARNLVYNVINMHESADNIIDIKNFLRTKVAKPSAKAG